MKAFILAAAAAAAFAAGGLATPSAEAAPLKKPGYHATHGKFHKVKVSPRERAAIRHSNADLARLKAKIYADGRVTTRERIQLNRAQQKHAALVRRALR